MAPTTSTSEPLAFTAFYNIIDGRREESRATRRTVNPATLGENPDVPVSTLEDVNKAVEAAQRAVKVWAEVPWSERQKAIEDFADALESHTDDFAQMLVKEQGKPIFWAKNEIGTGVHFLRGVAKLTLSGEVIEDTKERKIVTRYSPLGVSVGIVPWNYPVFIASAKMAPALLTGNAFILKSSPFTPYCNLKMAELGLRFFPPGVFQALSGDDDLGPWLTTHPGINMINFTGSAPNGKKILKACSDTLKRVTLELGGNDPAIICADVDPAAIVPRIALFSFCNAGQICMSIKRLYVHESVYDQVLSNLVEHVKALTLGVGETSYAGPVTNEAQYERVKGFFESVEKDQLTVATGGTKPLTDRKGFYLPLTIVDNPPDEAKVVREEQFGPVLPLMKWSDESDVIQRANDTETGLGASVWTRDEAQATRIAKQLQAGNIWINTHAEIEPIAPFGGYKQSGLRSDYGVEGLKTFCNLQSVYTRPG
ncbi:aldehyde dehydrogenase [Hypoxylon trugodes]|uniref:aldehyde dehydrogenase n=1 Tax=Hypoxylon trugodes TaxID=326681 RepID=UPI00219EB5C8|nr:aldehyde dehydrogenase [Hypoxylon trugodes]KAI1391097.1 aldehyde dehydrogenase [Hypoxylon trugodes]